MGAYYYLVPQLSHLIYGQTPPMTAAEFREMATPLLTGEDAALLDTIGLDPEPPKPDETGRELSYAEKLPPCGSDFIDNWREWERTLRLNLAKLRFIKLKREGAGPAEPPDFPVEAVATAAKAVQETPLEGESVIDKARWSAIESMQGNEYFGRNTIFAYLLKLMILERQASFQTETGFSEYKSLYASILEQPAAIAAVGTLSAGESK
ncbi:MAG: DUF2764 domain-containing protein [Treponema sp.]|nr:DUF2764 domain-containing protein [Treponema sp.]